MTASKENVAKALDHLAFVSDALPSHILKPLAARMLFIGDVLNAAKSKLPQESSFDKDRIRKKDAVR